MLIFISTSLGFTAICYFGLSILIRDRMYENISEIPHNQVGLVLGTSKYLPGGGINIYFKYRMDTAALLFRQRKINRIIVSGDNRTIQYNEPKMMKQALIEQGVPAEFIYQDYAGFRTRDSILRAYKIFGQTRFTIISQEYHAERAVFIAYCEGLNPIGFAERSMKVERKIYTREIFARVKAVLDVLWSTPPRFLGEKIDIY
ncbi:SanA/YdcF family protein [Bacteroidetes bacterium endosymbiont of Geopemphigus sp.]|uniref:SanA/YdcF family protein n=1 Tax=Bacteroidetes bacterium endosymbiont of Geopemphigus sp. TaxID=2047937 RepID=UPI001F4E5F04|nr:ElyC/SanA/YdcF family protein [Bacteroidetes bacterium endosymbiont of Geopemphigus sp.]